MRPIKYLLRLMTGHRETPAATIERPAPEWRKPGSGATTTPCEAKVLAALQLGPQTSYELSMCSGLGYDHVRVLITTLQRFGRVKDTGARGPSSSHGGRAPTVWGLAA